MFQIELCEIIKINVGKIMRRLYISTIMDKIKYVVGFFYKSSLYKNLKKVYNDYEFLFNLIGLIIGIIGLIIGIIGLIIGIIGLIFSIPSFFHPYGIIINDTQDEIDKMYYKDVIINSSNFMGNEYQYSHLDPADHDQLEYIVTELSDEFIISGINKSKVGQYNKSIQFYDLSLMGNPNNSEAWLYRSQALYKIDNFEEALSSIQKALYCNPNNSDSWRWKGHILTELKERCNIEYTDLQNNSIFSYNKALELNPNDTYALLGISNNLIENKFYREAIEYCDKILAIDSNNSLVFDSKGRALSHLGLENEAIENYNKAIVIDNHSWAYNNLGVCLGNIGQYNEAIKNFDEFIRLEPNEYLGYSNKAWICYLQQKYNDSNYYSNKAVQFANEDREKQRAYYRKEQSLKKLGQYEESFDFYFKQNKDAKIIVKKDLVNLSHRPFYFDGYAIEIYDIDYYEDRVFLSISKDGEWWKELLLSEGETVQRYLHGTDNIIEINVDKISSISDPNSYALVNITLYFYDMPDHTFDLDWDIIRINPSYIKLYGESQILLKDDCINGDNFSIILTNINESNAILNCSIKISDNFYDNYTLMVNKEDTIFTSTFFAKIKQINSYRSMILEDVTIYNPFMYENEFDNKYNWEKKDINENAIDVRTVTDNTINKSLVYDLTDGDYRWLRSGEKVQLPDGYSILFDNNWEEPNWELRYSISIFQYGNVLKTVPIPINNSDKTIQYTQHFGDKEDIVIKFDTANLFIGYITDLIQLKNIEIYKIQLLTSKQKNEKLSVIGNVISKNKTYAILTDSNYIWLGGTEGVERYNRINENCEKKLLNIPIYSFAIDDNNIWFGSEGVVGFYQRDDDNWKFFNFKDQLKHTEFTQIIVGDNKIWFITKDGIVSFNKSQEVWTSYSLYNVHSAYLEGDEIIFGTKEGIMILNKKYYEWKIYNYPKNIFSILPEHNDLFIGSNDKIFRFDVKNDSFETINLPEDCILCGEYGSIAIRDINKIDDDLLIIKGDLLKYDLLNNKLEIATNEFFNNNIIYSIEIIDDKFIIASENGTTIINSRDIQFSNINYASHKIDTIENRNHTELKTTHTSTSNNSTNLRHNHILTNYINNFLTRIQSE